MPNQKPKTTNYPITNQKIPPAFTGFKIAQISDLHIIKGRAPRIERTLAQTAKITPDIIVISGDFINNEKTDLGAAAEIMKDFTKIAPTYFIPGNHESYIGENYYPLEKSLERAGAVILHNRKTAIEKDGEFFNLYGLADYGIYCGEKLDETLLRQKLADLGDLNPAAFNVLLTHRPELFDFYAEKGFDLVFTGHAHGGQFGFPFKNGLYSPGQGLFPKLTNGTHKKNKTTMIISRGLGDGDLPIRFANPHEIVTATLRIPTP